MEEKSNIIPTTADVVPGKSEPLKISSISSVPIAPSMEKILPLSPLIQEAIEKLRPVFELQLTKEEEQALTRPLTEKEKSKILVKSTGIIFLPWTYYFRRMVEVFGVAGWTLYPVNGPAVSRDGENVWVEVLMAVRGCYIDTAYGECEYHPNNQQMTYSDAVEGARSNALSRLVAKRFGVALELWDEDFCDRWLRENAVVVLRKNPRGEIKRIWVRKDKIEPGDKVIQEAVETPKPPPLEKQPEAKEEPWEWKPQGREAQLRTIRAIAQKINWKEEDVKRLISEKFGMSSSKQLTDQQVAELFGEMRKIAVGIMKGGEENDE